MSPEERLRFGPFEANLSTGKVWKHGHQLHLQEQPARILTALLQHRGEVVSREDLTRLLWPDGTYVDFDRGLNAAVNRLRQALSDSAESPRYVETVARRGYRFIAPVELAAPANATPPPPQASATADASPRRNWLLSVAGTLLITSTAIVAAWLFVSRKPDAVSLPLKSIPLTSYQGTETHPTLSPDGSQVAFSWDGPSEDNQDIYVKTVGSDSPLRLTTNVAEDVYPAWSPDGRLIAFLRRPEGIFVVPPTGGPERKLPVSRVYPRAPSWSPDSSTLAFTRYSEGSEPGGIFALNLETGRTWRLAQNGDGLSYNTPAFSPDGRSLAYASCRAGIGSCNIQVVQLDANLNVTGIAKTLAVAPEVVESIAWAQDQQSLIVAEFVYAQGGSKLTQVALRPQNGLRPLLLAGDASFAATTKLGQRFAYSHSYEDFDLFLWRGGEFKRSPLSSTLLDSYPHLSPDGSKIAFGSTRSGALDVWVANTDGGVATQLTRSRASGTPRWSPDGKWIVFDTQNAEGTWDIQLSDSAGGQVRPVAHHKANDKVPSFSRDGKWIYFSSNREGVDLIFRVPVSGGDPVRITNRRAWVAFESFDGKALYYAPGAGCNLPLFVTPLTGGGAERTVIDSVCGRGFSVTEKGIIYTAGPDQQHHVTVRLFDIQTGQSREIARVDGPLHGQVQLAASLDGNIVILAASRTTGADLYVVENFR